MADLKATLTLVKDALYDAKFAMEQDFEGEYEKRVFTKVREALDALSELQRELGFDSERNPLLVTTLSDSLAEPPIEPKSK